MIVTVDRERFRLELWRPARSRAGFQRVGKWPVGLGREGQATPRGVYSVVAMSRRPAWVVPDSEWAIARGLKPGARYEFKDPENPFKGGFISLSGGEGIGIHGTKFDPEVGARVSSGCIRMYDVDLRRLYARVRVGTAVVIL